MSEFIVGAFSVIATAAGFYFIINALRVRGSLRAVPWQLFLITTKEEDAAAEIETAQKLLRALAAFKKTFVLEAAVPHVGDRIHFYVAVRREFADKAHRRLEHLFGQLSVEPIHENHVVFYPHGVAAAAHLAQKEAATVPIPTYAEMGVDMFKDVLLAFREVAAIGEGAAVQFVVRSEGQSANTSTLMFAVNGRIIVSAGTEFRTRGLLHEIVSSFEKFKGPGRNALKGMVSRTPKKLVRQFLDKEFDSQQSLFLSVEELAHLYHCSTFPRRDVMMEIEAGLQGECFIFPARGSVRSQTNRA